MSASFPDVYYRGVGCNLRLLRENFASAESEEPRIVSFAEQSGALVACATLTCGETTRMTAEGYTQIECEVPVQKREASGAEFNGIINLLATSDGKRLILDHKSGAGSFAGYFAQLDAYRGILVEQVEAIQLNMAIHWIDRRTVEVVSN